MIALARLDHVSTGGARPAAIALSGLGCGAAALVFFGVAHALLIVPIWDKLLRGVPFVLVGGLAFGWAFDRLVEPARRHSARARVEFGALMFLALVPSTLLDTALRLTGLRHQSALETATAIVLAATAGGLIGWIRTGRRDAVVACAAGAVALMMASAGPLPAAQSMPGFWLSVAIAPICVAAGAALATTRRLIARDAT